MSKSPRTEQTNLTGGRTAISGFLFQILRSIQLGLRVSVTIVAGDASGARMQLTIEPADGGDHQIDDGNVVIIEQVKMRASHRRWSPGAIARQVFPDLLQKSHPGTAQDFRFVTNNPTGLDTLKQFLDARRGLGPGTASSKFRWARQNLTIPEFTERLAAEVGTRADEPVFQWLLDNLTLEVIGTHNVEREIDALLAPMLAPGQLAETKRQELTGRLLQAASEGRTLQAYDLLALIHPEAYLRLAHAQSIPRILAQRLQSDCRALGYDHSKQARRDALELVVPLTVISGESGQGKTWTLCHSALAQADRGELAVVMSAPGSIDRLIMEINERVWLPAFVEGVLPQVMARRLGQAAKAPDGFWLTVYVDDLQNRRLAEDISRLDWADLGIRIVVSAQPRITDAISLIRNDARITVVENFTSAELRRYLRRHDREAPLEIMPDDVFELLLKPIHAKIFTDLPERRGWTDVTEYELFKSYWNFATSRTRAQSDHPSDREGLTDLAGSLIGERPRYPWRSRDIRAARLTDSALLRLEQVGLIRWVDTDRLAFASDRMLNWAVAEWLCIQIVDDQWSPEQVDRELERLDTIVAAQDEPVGRRLGYVFLDTVWLLSGATTPEFVADLLLARVQRLPQEWRGEKMWSQHLATVGSRLVPSLERLALREYDEEHDWDIPRNIPLALAAIAETDRDAVGKLVGRLLASGNENGVAVALNTARRVQSPEALDALWDIHIAREAEFDRHDAEPDHRDEQSRLFRRREISLQAVRTAVAASPGWLDLRIRMTVDPLQFNQLLWILADDDCVKDEDAREIWARHRERLLQLLPNDSKAMINALGHFDDLDNRAWLDNVPLRREDWMPSRVLRSRARLDPATALRQIRERDEDYGWSAADWWLPELARSDPDGLSAAIRENASKGEDPLTDTILYYSRYPELMDRPTLEWVLDEFALKLRSFNEASDNDPDGRPGRLAHPLRFLPTLTESWQFECLSRRAGGQLEEELIRFATRRAGRTSRVRDTEGQECERLLAMIDERGFDELVIAELQRPDPFGREDGFIAAHWSQSNEVREALRASGRDAAPYGYRQVIRMQAFAIHQCDAELEAMIRAQTPVYVNAAEMRADEGRQTASLRERVEQLVASREPDDVRVAAQLAGFLREAEEARILLPVFLNPDTVESTKRAIIGTFRALGFFDPSLLPVARELIEDRIDSDAQFAAAYLAGQGDSEARRIVIEWLRGLDLGTWSSSHQAFLLPLADHDDSRGAVIEFLLRSRERGHVLLDSHYVRLLADGGDVRARDDLIRAAYREPRFGGQDTSAGIAWLRTIDSDEAFFAARRYLARHGATPAIELMLQIDASAAVPILVDRYRNAEPSLQWEIACCLRIYVPAPQLKELLDDIADSQAAEDRVIASDLASWTPPNTPFAWLTHFADNGPSSVRAAARSALRSRAREAAAMSHLQTMKSSSKPLRWARLQTIFDCVDPRFLWSRTDPASLNDMIDSNPPEFLVEARQLRSRCIKKLQDEAKKADRGAR